MLKKLQVITMTLLIAMLVIGVSAFAATHAFADSKSDICNGVGIATGANTTCGTAQDGLGLNGIIKTVVSILSIAVGVVAVIMIIIGGLRYVLSGGDSNNINSAKNTILYAIVGLVVAAMAQVLVHFVLAKV